MLPPVVLAMLLVLPRVEALTATGVDARQVGSIAARNPGAMRTLRFDAGRQAVLLDQVAWRSFRAAEGQGWSARFDQRTRLPFRAWGPGIALGLGPGADLAAVERAVRQALAAHPGLLGVDARDLVPGRGGFQARTGTWFVRLDQVHDGVPVVRAGVELRVRDGALVMFGVKTFPDIPALGAPQLDGAAARAIAIAEGPLPDIPHALGEQRLVVLPWERGSGLGYALAWEVHTATHDPVGRWVAWVDARTGALLAVRSELMSLTGLVQGVHDRRTVDGDTTTSPMPSVYLWSAEGGSTYTDDSGAFTLDGESFESELDGDHVRVENAGGAEGQLAFTGALGTWTDADADPAEIDSYVFLHHVRDWALRFQPENSITQRKLTSRVNVAKATCNAWFDGDLNFGLESGHCNATGRIADVNYHEWGHGFHYWGLLSGWFDETASEGIADSIAVFQTGDPVIAPYFWSGYPQGIRDVSEDRVYPDDIVYESHEDSLILSGAVWDLLQGLEADLGPEEGWAETCRIFADAAPAGYLITEAFDEFVLADDDDGDLSNGTPHYCALLEAFVPHGLGPAGSTSLLAFVHDPLDNQPAGEEGYPVEVVASAVTGGCFEVEMTGGRAWYSHDDGESWDYVGFSREGESLLATLPAAEAGDIVLYYLEAETSDGGVVGLPAGGRINPFSFAVGDLVPLYFEDFEQDDGGYAHALLEGEVTEGADDWMWGTPTGAAQDPDYAWSGDNVWGNDLGGGNYNGEYQDGKLNELSSVAIEVAPYNELLVQFRRWLQVEDGYYDHANVLVDDVLAWTNHASTRDVGDEHHRDQQWALASVTGDDADLDGAVVVSWQIDSDEGLAFGGWNIDDVAVYAPPTPRNLMVIDDFSASDDEPGLTLTWTNPAWDGLAELQVVHRADAFPTSHEDPAGLVVLHVDAPAPGEPVETSISEAPAGVGYYAIYAADGDGTWTRGAYEGFNADLGTPGEAGGQDSDEGDTPSGGCGCASGHARGGWLTLVIALLATPAARRSRGIRTGRSVVG